MEDEVLVQVKFTIERNGIKFTDALYFTMQEYKDKTKAEIRDMKNERFRAYKEMVDNPAPEKPDELQLEEITKDKANILADLDQLTRREQRIKDRKGL